ncbi:hypothetical protein BH10BAC3_BH10BAC3_25600 [soil metagenome]
MYKFLFCAGLFLLSAFTLPAQHNDELLNEENYSAMHNGLDEKSDRFVVEKNKISKNLLKSLPALPGKSVAISAINTGRKKGSLIAEDSGRELFSTGFKRNNLHGTWVSRYTDATLIDSGNFHHGIPDGEWRSWYPDGKLRSIRTYNAVKWYAVESEISRRNTRIYYHQLSKLMGWNNQKFESLTKGSASFASLPDANKRYQPPFRYCLHHGLFMNFYSNGAAKDSGYYKDGLRDGSWNEYYPNGQVSAAGAYLNGLKNSGWKYYNREGRLTMLSEYKHGKLMHRKTYNGLYGINQ